MLVVVMTSDDYVWKVRPFAQCFNYFWSDKQPVFVGGYTPPTFPLPPNFSFFSIDKRNYPKNRWSDGFIRVLNAIRDDYFVLMFEDYWLTSLVDIPRVEQCMEYIQSHGDVLRMDLTADRACNSSAVELEKYKDCNIIQTPNSTPYQMSFQAGIWNRHLLLSLMSPGVSPWDIEIFLQLPDHIRVVGTKDCPVKYINWNYK